MNSFHKSTQQSFCLLLMIVLNSPLYALTFRNEPLTNFIESGKLLCADFPENNFVVLELENDNFDIYGGDINKLDDLKEVFEEVMANRGACISSRVCNISSNTINYNSSYLVGRESMNIAAKTALNLIRCRLESPMISITGSTINFVDSFLINPEVLNIIIDYPGSAYKAIQIIFHNQPQNPTVITGEIDFGGDEQGRRLIISNVREIRMQFAWDKIPSETVEAAGEDLEITPEETPVAVVDQDADTDALTTPVCLYETVEEAVEKVEEQVVIINAKKEAVIARQNEKIVSAKSNTQSRSILSGFVAKSREAIVAFYKKYITPYF